MLMSSTLDRDSSSVLRSRPIGLPRYQEKEKCGPRIPPPASHWQPTEFFAVLTNPLIWVSLFTVSSVTPPHCGKDGPWLPLPDDGAVDPWDWDWFEPESEHADAIGIRAAAAHASAARLCRTGCTVAAPPWANHRTRGELWFLCVQQLSDARGTAAPVRAAVPMAGRGGDDAAVGQPPGLAVSPDGQRHDHRRRHRQGRHRCHRPTRTTDVRG